MMKKFFRTLLLIINLFFVVLFVFSTMAEFVSPRKFILFSFLSYGYGILLIANILFVMVWLILKRWEFLISTLAIVLRISVFPYFFQFGGGSSRSDASLLDGSDLVVMSFNAHLFSGKADSESDTKGNIAQFLDVVGQQDPDVMCLQEFCNIYGVGDSIELQGYKYMYSDKSPRGYVHPYGTVLYSKYPIVKIGDVQGSTKFFVDIKVHDDTVRAFCVHLDSYELTESDYEELENLSQGTFKKTMYKLGGKMKTTILQHEEEWDILHQAIQESPYPVIIAGDFNDTPMSYICGRMRRLLNDSFEGNGKGFGVTYHGRYPNYRIDYVYHSSSIKVLSYSRIKSDMSDHYPIVVHLDFENTNKEDPLS